MTWEKRIFEQEKHLKHQISLSEEMYNSLNRDYLLLAADYSQNNEEFSFRFAELKEKLVDNDHQLAE